VIEAVLDTNVLASGFIGETKRDSIPGELVRRWRARTFTLILSDYILAELANTFTAPYFTERLSTREIANALASLRVGSLIQPITMHISGVATHPEDDPILATALSAQARYLVTGDKPLLSRISHRGTLLLSPRQFLEILDRNTLS
jgi:uncharacterized protein